VPSKIFFADINTKKDFKLSVKAGWDTHGLPVELGTEKEIRNYKRR
jgi:isoleucyl-tRNA synthetase